MLVKVILNALYGEFQQKDILDSYECKSEAWMFTEYDESVKDCWRISHGNCFIRMIDDAGLEDEVQKVNTLPLQLAALTLWNSKRIMNNFLHANNGFCTNNVYYTDTDSLYIEKKHWDKLDKAGLVGKGLLPGKAITKMEVSSTDCF